MGKTLIRLIKEKRESVGLSTNELSTLLGIDAYSYICIESGQCEIKPVMEEALSARLKISSREWEEAKETTRELKEFKSYQKAFIQLVYRSKNADVAKCLTMAEYKVMKTVLPNEIITDILGQLSTLDSITAIIDKNK